MGINLGSTAISDLKVGETQVDKVYLGEEVVWEKAAPSIRALKFELVDPTDATATLKMSKVGNPTGQNFEYSYDGSIWNSVTLNTAMGYVNGIIYIRGMNINGISSGRDNRITFVSTGTSKVACSGNIMHLVDYTQDILTIPNNSCFNRMFYQNGLLATPPELPATTLTSDCYVRMFNECANLEITPALPATSLENYCYQSMFENCISLVTVTNLPARDMIVSAAYLNMFDGCTSLVVSNTQTGTAQYRWDIPSAGWWQQTSTSGMQMFYRCAGTRSSDDLRILVGQSQTFYTQNPPIGVL